MEGGPAQSEPGGGGGEYLVEEEHEEGGREVLVRRGPQQRRARRLVLGPRAPDHHVARHLCSNPHYDCFILLTNHTHYYNKIEFLRYFL